LRNRLLLALVALAGTAALAGLAALLL